MLRAPAGSPRGAHTGGEPVRLAVLGDPLAYTRSPDLHRAGLAALGLAGDSWAFPTPQASLGARLAGLAAEGYRGVNLTRPLKEAALPHLARTSDAAREARSVNTVGFDADGWWGDTTDGPGLIDLLHALGRETSRERVVLLGAGGAARSLAFSLTRAGVAALCASARAPRNHASAWRDIPGAALVEWRSGDEVLRLAEATLVINATPLTGDPDPAPLASIAREALILDLVYGERLGPWVLRARAEDRAAYDGLGLLVHQARRSLALWFGRPVPLEPLAHAVGWPR